MHYGQRKGGRPSYLIPEGGIAINWRSPEKSEVVSQNANQKILFWWPIRFLKYRDSDDCRSMRHDQFYFAADVFYSDRILIDGAEHDADCARKSNTFVDNFFFLYIFTANDIIDVLPRC